MFRFSASAIFVLACSAGISTLGAATPVIGVAISSGNILINNSSTPGNANVFDGTVLQTDKTAQVHMNGGATLQFGTDSRAKLFSDHIDLQSGTARISGLSATANGLRIAPDKDSAANVSIHGPVVQVAALNGNVHVMNAQGVLVANLLPGSALDLKPQDAGAMAPSSLTGCVQKSGSAFTLTDETSKVTVELRGGNLRAGRRVQVSGSMVANATPAGGATQVVTVASLKDLGGGCKAGAMAAGAAGGAGAAGAAGAAAGATGAAIGTTTAVVAGVAAAAVAGTAVGVAESQNGSSTTSANGSSLACPTGQSLSGGSCQ